MKKQVTILLESETLDTIDNLSHAMGITRSSTIQTVTIAGLQHLPKVWRNALEVQRMKDRKDGV